MNLPFLNLHKNNIRWRKFAIIMIVYLLVLTLGAAYIIFDAATDPFIPAFDPNSSMWAYEIISMIGFAFIVFISPFIYSRYAEAEEDRILYKLFKSICMVILLIIAGLPVYSVVFIFGGVSIPDVLYIFAFYIITAVAFCSTGIFFSTYIKNKTLSKAAIYGTIVFLTIISIIITIMVSPYYSESNGKAVFPLIYCNPFAGLISLIHMQFNYQGLFGSNGLPSPQISGAVNSGKGIAIWIGNLIFNICLTVLFSTLSCIKTSRR